MLCLIIGTRLGLLDAELAQCCLTFVPDSKSQWNDLDDPMFDGAGLVGFQRGANMLSCFSKSVFFVFHYYIFLPSVGWLCRDDLFGLIEFFHSLPVLHC